MPWPKIMFLLTSWTCDQGNAIKEFIIYCNFLYVLRLRLMFIDNTCHDGHHKLGVEDQAE